MAWSELFSFQELSRAMRNLFFENSLQAKGFLFLNEKPFSLLSNSLQSDCLNDVLDYSVTECFSIFSSCIFFCILLSSILLLRPVENTQYMEIQWKFPEGGGVKSTKISRGTAKVWKGCEWVIFCLSGLFLILRQNHLKRQFSSPRRRVGTLCFWEALSKTHLWIPVPPLN